MDTVANLKEGNQDLRAKYFLNDDATIKKLKKAAGLEPMTIIDNINSKTINFNSGTYISVVSPLVKLWQELEDHHILEEDVDGMKIMVKKVEIEKEMANLITKYIVRLVVQGVKVTVTCYDTTLSMFIQASQATLVEYCSRVLFTYLQEEIKVCQVRIAEINDHIGTYGEVKTTTRQQKKAMRKGPAIMEPPPDMLTRKRNQDVLEPPCSFKKARQGLLAKANRALIPTVDISPTRSDQASFFPQIRSATLLEIEYEELVAPARPPTKEKEKEQEVMTPPQNEQEAVMPPQKEKELMTPPRKEQEVATPPQKEQEVVAPPLKEKEGVMPPQKEQEVVTPPQGEQGAVTLPQKEQEVVTPPQEEQEVVTPPQKEQEFVAEFVADFVSDVVNLVSPEQLKEPPAAQAPAPANFSAVCYPCTMCQNVFTSSDLLRIHIQDDHIKEKIIDEHNSLTASGRLIQLSPNFGSRHNKFMKTINLDNIEVEDLSSAEDDEEEDAKDEFECNKCTLRVSKEKTPLKHKEKKHQKFVCAVCRESCINVANLQEHILSNHSNKSVEVIEALKMQMQLLNSVLKNQGTLEKKLSNIDLKQSCLATEVKEVKNVQQSMLRPVESPPPLSTPIDPQQPPTYAERTSTVAPRW